jgi:hypothetical protein
MPPRLAIGPCYAAHGAHTASLPTFLNPPHPTLNLPLHQSGSGPMRHGAVLNGRGLCKLAMRQGALVGLGVPYRARAPKPTCIYP